MPDQSDIDAVNEAIADNAQRPNRTRFGNREVQQHSLSEQIEAANHLQGQQAAAANRPGLGLRLQQIMPKYY